jgi:hypothetical protein
LIFTLALDSVEARPTKRRVTDEQKRVNAALEAAKGDREIAALGLEMDPVTLKEFINNNKVLRARWANSKKNVAPDPTKLVARTAITKLEPGAPSPEEQKLALVTQHEDAKFKAGFEKFGFTAEDVDFAQSLQQFAGKNFAKVVDFATGGMTYTLMQVMKKIKMLADILENAEEPKDEIMVAINQGTWANFHKLCELQIKMTETAANGAAIRAKVELWKKQAEAGQGGKGKVRPGFAPLQAQKMEVNVQPGATVNVTQKEESPK